MTASIYTWENILTRADKLDYEMQMLLCKAYTEDVLGDSIEYADYLDDSDVFDLCVELWAYTCKIDHNHCSIAECDYDIFVRDIVDTPLEDLHILSENMDSPEPQLIWRKIQNLRKLL